MAMALTAWLIAAAPIACNSAVPFSRTTPASAPATAVGFDLAATLSTSISTTSCRSGDTPGPGALGGYSLRGVLGNPPARHGGGRCPLGVGPADPFDAPGAAGVPVDVKK